MSRRLKRRSRWGVRSPPCAGSEPPVGYEVDANAECREPMNIGMSRLAGFALVALLGTFLLWCGITALGVAEGGMVTIGVLWRWAMEGGLGMREIVNILISVASGGMGYFIITFWMQPILKYQSIKYRIISDLFFYANVINANEMNDDMKERMNQRIQADRRNSSDLEACCPILPLWYKWYLNWRGEHAQKAAKALIGLSNTVDYEEAAESVESIKKHLRIKSEDI